MEPTEVHLKFHGKENILEILDTGGSIVRQLAAESPICPLIGSEIELVSEIGKGTYGTVFLIKFPGMGERKYVAKRVNIKDLVDKVHYTRFPKSNTLGNLGDFLRNQFEINKDIFIQLNGGDENQKIGKYGLKEVLVPHYAKICLSKKATVERLDNDGNTLIPKGSYICENITYSEYVNSVLVGQLYRNGISINFIDVFNFSTCATVDKPAQYTFMEKIDNTLRNIKKCVIDNSIFEGLLIQILHAIAVYQDHYQISHNDLHDANIFIDYIVDDTKEYKGQKLIEADYFHYEVGDTDIYIPFIPIIAKIGDFGVSVKWSSPIVADKSVIDGSYDIPIPNWYSPQYDLLFIIRTLYEWTSQNKFIRSIFAAILNVKISKLKITINKRFDSYRPILKYLSLSTKTARDILKDKKIMAPYIRKPSGGTISTLGIL